jgi:hypothetical protein
MSKPAETPIQLPKMGCDECKDSPIVGMVMVQKAGMRRFMDKCKCRIERERAKKAMRPV